MQKFLVPALTVCLLASAVSSRADNGAGSGDRKPPGSESSAGAASERSAAVMTFVKQHHPELAELLVYLRDNLPDQHNKAVRDLYRTSERLARLRNNGDQDRYELELRIWQTRSRTRLLSARIRMGSDAQLESELRKLLELQIQLRVRLLEQERDRTIARVDRLNEQIEHVRATRQQVIDRHLRKLAEAKYKAAMSKLSVKRGAGEPSK